MGASEGPFMCPLRFWWPLQGVVRWPTSFGVTRVKAVVEWERGPTSGLSLVLVPSVPKTH